MVLVLRAQTRNPFQIVDGAKYANFCEIRVSYASFVAFVGAILFQLPCSDIFGGFIKFQRLNEEHCNPF